MEYSFLAKRPKPCCSLELYNTNKQISYKLNIKFLLKILGIIFKLFMQTAGFRLLPDAEC